MRKKIIGFITLCSMLVILSCNSFAMNENNIDIYIDNSKLEIPEEYGNVFIDDKNTEQIPLRIILESLGYEVRYKYQSGIYRIDILSPEVVNDEVDVINITNAKVDHYYDSDRLGRIRSDIVGSVNNSMVGTRSNGSSHQEDIDTFNKALENSTWMLSDQGSLQGRSQTDNDSNTSLKVERDNQGKPLVKLRNWSINPGDGLLNSIIMTQNVFMESCKFYSKTPIDGEGIYWYVNKALKEGDNIEFEKVLKFGQTKIMFKEPEVFGIDVIFVD